MQSNLYGPWRMAQALLPLLRQSPAGRIVNVSSGAGSHADPMFGLTTDNAMGARPPAQSANGVVRAALLPVDGPTRAFSAMVSLWDAQPLGWQPPPSRGFSLRGRHCKL